MIDIAKVERLMELMSKHGVDVVQAESNGEKLSLARNAAQAHLLFPSAPAVAQQSPALSGHQSPSSESNAHNSSTLNPALQVEPTKETKLPAGEVITSPFVGTFYRAANPTSSPFTEVGARVRKGQALCIVEAMKLMNEIECEIDGEVVAVLAENGKPVEFGTPLFVINPTK